jgi:hypothetical protein
MSIVDKRARVARHLRKQDQDLRSRVPLTKAYGKKKFSREHCRNISLGKQGKPYKSVAAGKFGKMFKRGVTKVRQFVDRQENDPNSATRKLHKVVRKPIVNNPKVRRAWLKGVHKPIQGIARKMRKD